MVKRSRRWIIAAFSLLIAATTVRADETNQSAEVVVYGGTAGGVTAAVAAARQGRSVILVEPQVRVGGMISGGLCKTDLGAVDTVGGLSREFFDRLHDYYLKTYGTDSQQYKDSNKGLFPEPKIAQKVLMDMLDETKHVTLLLHHRLVTTTVADAKITSIAVQDTTGGSPTVITGKVFIDTSYEGDLMAQAGVPYVVGREGRTDYNESLAGITFMNSTWRDMPAGILGMPDGKVESYNIRGTITDDKSRRVPFPKPAHYDITPFKAMKQGLVKKDAKTLLDLFGFLPTSKMPNGEYDPNCSDMPGMNFNYVEGTWAERQRVYETVRDHWLSLFYMLTSDPELPEAFRNDVANNWGLPKDEFTESGNVTPQLYIREARRMLGQYVLTQDDVRNNRFKPDGVCMGSYNIDCHIVQRLTTPHGTVEEGSMTCGVDPYEIPYRSLVPTNVNNLIVGSAISATHVAYSTLRMEPVYMMIGHAAGLAADLAVRGDTAVQKINTDQLRDELRKQKMPLDAPYRPVVAIDTLPGGAVGTEMKFAIHEVLVRKPLKSIRWNFDGSGAVQAEGPTATYTFKTAKKQNVSVIVEDEAGARSNLTFAVVSTGHADPEDVDVAYNNARNFGEWDRWWSGEHHDRRGYLRHKGDNEKPDKVRFTPTLAKTGRYMLCMAVMTGPAQASNVTVKIAHADGASDVKVNEKDATLPFVYRPLGEFLFKAGDGGYVEVNTAGATGEVVVDAFRWVWIGE